MFSPEYLSSFSNNDSESLIIHQKSLANKLGFKLSQKDSISNFNNRIYCSKANILKGENKYTKTRCEFKVIILKKRSIILLCIIFLKIVAFNIIMNCI